MSHRTEGPGLFLHVPLGIGRQQARYVKPLVNIQPTATRIQHLHDTTSSPKLPHPPGEGRFCVDTLLRAAYGEAQQLVIHPTFRIKLLTGSGHENLPISAPGGRDTVGYRFSSLVASPGTGVTVGLRFFGYFVPTCEVKTIREPG